MTIFLTLILFVAFIVASIKLAGTWYGKACALVTLLALWQLFYSGVSLVTA